MSASFFVPFGRIEESKGRKDTLTIAGYSKVDSIRSRFEVRRMNEIACNVVHSPFGSAAVNPDKAVRLVFSDFSPLLVDFVNRNEFGAVEDDMEVKEVPRLQMPYSKARDDRIMSLQPAG